MIQEPQLLEISSVGDLEVNGDVDMTFIGGLVNSRIEKEQFDDPLVLAPVYVYPDDCMVHK